MKRVNLHLEDKVLEETEELRKRLQKSRNRYINEALRFYNIYQKRRQLADQLRAESEMVAASSMEILEDMERLEDESGLERVGLG